MGQEMTISPYIPCTNDKVSRERFEFLNIIGRGGFGKVWRVKDKRNNKIYAVKEMNKLKIIHKKSEIHVKYERELLTRLRNPFIVNMYYAFQDYDNLYIVLDYLSGGDLRYHIHQSRKFSEEKAKFCIGCIIIALEYIHSKNIIHRDLKPENIVFDEDGYLRLTDFGIAKLLLNKTCEESSGTLGYMSPEVVRGKNHSFEADYFAIGVIAYEVMIGKRPYFGKTKKEMKEQIFSTKVKINKGDIPNDWSPDSADFINKLMEVKPTKRLGYQKESDIKNHPWLEFYPWIDLIKKKLPSPFIINKHDNYHRRISEHGDLIGIDTQNKYLEYRNRYDYDSLFENFTYYNIDIFPSVQILRKHQSMPMKAAKKLTSSKRKFLSHPQNGIKSSIENDRNKSNSPMAKPINNNKNFSIKKDKLKAKLQGNCIQNKTISIDPSLNNINDLKELKNQSIWSNQYDQTHSIVTNKSNSQNNIIGRNMVISRRINSNNNKRINFSRNFERKPNLNNNVNISQKAFAQNSLRNMILSKVINDTITDGKRKNYSTSSAIFLNQTSQPKVIFGRNHIINCSPSKQLLSKESLISPNSNSYCVKRRPLANSINMAQYKG